MSTAAPGNLASGRPEAEEALGASGLGPGRVFRAGRVLLGICFLLDAGWYLASYDVRAAYLRAGGSPEWLIWATVAIYLAGGLALAAERKVGPAAAALAATLVVTTIALYPAVRAGGIGEFPPELWYEVGFKETVVHTAMIGALLLAAAVPTTSPAARSGIRADLYKAGRVLLGGYFVINGLWQWYYLDIRVEHILAAGRNPGALPVIIGLQLLAGTLIGAGTAIRVATVPMMLIIVVSTVVVHGNLSPSAPYPPNVQIHQWFVKAAILAGLIMTFGIGRRPEPAPARADS